MPSPKKNKKNKIQQVNQPYPKMALVGFRGIGKSTISIELIKYWDTRIISLDKYIEEQHRRKVKDIVIEKGWDFFREEEALSLKKLCEEKPPLLLDTGGGIIEKADGSPSHVNIDLLKEVFFSIYLYMSKEDAIQRLKRSEISESRPHLIENVHDVYERREPLYRKTASAIIDIAHATKQEITKIILSSF